MGGLPIRTYEGWLYLAVVLDLFSNQNVSRSMQSQMDKELLIGAIANGLIETQTPAHCHDPLRLRQPAF